MARMIDADALRLKFTTLHETPNGIQSEMDAYAIKCIDDAPTIEERKKGKWMYQSGLGWGETWICSECGEKTTSTVMGEPRYKWCPMCGARMTEGEKI